MDHLLNYVTPAVIAAIVAAVMSISLPWVNWGIEKRRLQRQRRVDYIDAVRKIAQEDNPDLSELIRTPEYAALRQHLPTEYVAELEQSIANLSTGMGNSFKINIVLGTSRSAGANNFRIRFFDELTKLEIKWKLV
jgi:hypothetical protein